MTVGVLCFASCLLSLFSNSVITSTRALTEYLDKMMHQRIPIVLTNEGNFFDTFRGRYERVEDETKKLTQIAAEVQYNHKLDNYFQSEVDKLHTMKIIHVSCWQFV